LHADHCLYRENLSHSFIISFHFQSAQQQSNNDLAKSDTRIRAEIVIFCRDTFKKWIRLSPSNITDLDGRKSSSTCKVYAARWKQSTRNHCISSSARHLYQLAIVIGLPEGFFNTGISVLAAPGAAKK